MFKMNAVESSNIAAIGFDPINSVMRVAFKNGTTYDYQNVEKTIFDLILNAESVGKSFNLYVKSKPTEYPYQKVVGEELQKPTGGMLQIDGVNLGRVESFKLDTEDQTGEKLFTDGQVLSPQTIPRSITITGEVEFSNMTTETPKVSDV